MNNSIKSYVLGMLTIITLMVAINIDVNTEVMFVKNIADSKEILATRTVATKTEKKVIAKTKQIKPTTTIKPTIVVEVKRDIEESNKSITRRKVQLITELNVVPPINTVLTNEKLAIKKFKIDYEGDEYIVILEEEYNQLYFYHSTGEIVGTKGFKDFLTVNKKTKNLKKQFELQCRTDHLALK